MTVTQVTVKRADGDICESDTNASDTCDSDTNSSGTCDSEIADSEVGDSDAGDSGTLDCEICERYTCGSNTGHAGGSKPLQPSALSPELRPAHVTVINADCNIM